MNLSPLRDALVASECNKLDQVTTLIEACLEEGILNGVEIVRLISALGYNRQFVGLLLKKNAGGNPTRYRWYRSIEGHYRLH